MKADTPGNYIRDDEDQLVTVSERSRFEPLLLVALLSALTIAVSMTGFVLR